MDLVAVKIDVTLAAPRLEVYSAWSDPNKLSGWLCEDASGTAQAGGTLVLGWPSLGQTISLNVAEARPGELLRVAADVGGATHTQELLFADDGDGTRLCIRHSAPSHLARGIDSGWRLRLHILEHFLRSGGHRKLVTVAGSAVGGEQEVFDRLSEATRLHLGEPSKQIPPDGLCGHLSDRILYVVRRFDLVAPANLVAAQLMSWQDDDLDAHRDLLVSLIEQVGGTHPSPAVH